MTQPSGPYGRITHHILTFLRTQPGAHFTAGEVAQQLGCPLAQTRMALDLLAQDGVIDREELASGVASYVYHPLEPSSQG